MVERDKDTTPLPGGATRLRTLAECLLFLTLVLGQGGCARAIGDRQGQDAAAKRDRAPKDAPRRDRAPDRRRPDRARPPDLRQPDLPGADLPGMDLKPPPDLTQSGKWYQADKKYCVSFCKGKGLTNTASVEGATCMSGEARPASGINQGIKFTYGCWGGCGPMAAPLNTASTIGRRCYIVGKPKDADLTDWTVGCFCK